MNQYFNGKLSLFLTEVDFDTSEENQVSNFQNCIFFQNSLVSHEPHNQVKCRFKKKSELFIKQKFNSNLYCFQVPRLYSIVHSNLITLSSALFNLFIDKHG